MKRIAIAFALIFGIFSAKGQDKVVTEKIDRKVEIRNEGDKVHLKIIENGETVVDKSYNSMEDLKADESLKEYNVGVFGNGEKKVMLKDEDGNVHKLDGNETNVWISDDSDSDSKINMIFNSEDGTHVNVTKDANGNMTVERDGVVVDIDAMHKSSNVKIKKLEDGTLIIEDENGSRQVSPEDMKSGNVVFISEDGELDTGGKTMQFKTKDAEGNITIELNGVGTWVSDSLHDADHNVMFFETHDIESDGEHQVIIEKMVNDEDGKMVKIIIERIHLSITDLDDLKEVEEIPGSNVVSSKVLQLEEVNYYPNPNTGVFNLQFTAKENPTQIRVIDMMGKEVHNENLRNFEGRYDNSIDLSDSEKGMYILQIIQGKKTWNKKIVIE